MKKMIIKNTVSLTRIIVYLFLMILLEGALSKPAIAQTAETSDEKGYPSLGGPDAVESQIESDRTEKKALYESKLLKPYFKWQADLKEKHAFSFGIDYTGVYLEAK